MIRVPLLILCVLVWGALPTGIRAQNTPTPATAPPATAAGEVEKAVEIEVEGLTADSVAYYHFNEGMAYGTNGVVIRYWPTVLTAQRASVNLNTGAAEAEGDVIIQRNGEVWKGDRVRYNFKTRELDTSNFRTGRTPFYLTGTTLEGQSNQQSYLVRGAELTTDDVREPSYSIRAKSIKVTEGKTLEARQATLRLGGVPVMYFPRYTVTRERHPNNWVFTPGFRSLYGPFMLGTYNWFLSTNFSAHADIDYRQRRGFGGGPGMAWDMGAWGKGDGRFYYTRDEDPRTDVDGRPIQEHRRRLNFTHQVSIRTNFIAKAVLREQSDAQFIRDFFESEYRKDPQPKSFFEANYFWPNFSLDVLAQPQRNDFFQTVERLPDVKLSAARQQLGVSPIYYDGETSVGYFRLRPAERFGTNGYAAMRADTLHQLFVPQTYFGWLNLTPRVGARFTHYGESEGNDTVLDDAQRSVFNTGAEMSFKTSRTWTHATNRWFDVSGLRHILEPSLNYVFVPTPSRAPRELPQFDSEIPSLRLLPLDFPDYYAIDSVDSQNVMRLGVRNRVQTKRGGEMQDLLNWALYTDWRLDPRADQETFADVFSDMDFRPRSWLSLSSELRWNVDDGQFRYGYNSVTFTPDSNWSLAVGQLYFREDPRWGVDSENNLLRVRAYYRLNENWGFRTTHHFEARDGVLEEQYYSIYRDLRSWTAALTFRVRENRMGADDFTIALTFSLKAFPRFGLGRDSDQHSWLFGG